MEKDRPDRQDQFYRLAALPDDRIDTDDIPEAPAEAWRHARRPQSNSTASIALAVEELDDETLRALAASRMDYSYDRLNPLMD